MLFLNNPLEEHIYQKLPGSDKEYEAPATHQIEVIGGSSGIKLDGIFKTE